MAKGKLHVWYGAMSEKIYAGNVTASGTTTSKCDVTSDAVDAVVRYLRLTESGVEIARSGEIVGRLEFIPADKDEG